MRAAPSPIALVNCTRCTDVAARTDNEYKPKDQRLQHKFGNGKQNFESGDLEKVAEGYLAELARRHFIGEPLKVRPAVDFVLAAQHPS